MNRYFIRIMLCCLSLAVYPATAGEVFVKEAGSGDFSGKDWDNALRGDSLVRLVYNAPRGTTIYVAEGLYNPYYAIYQSDGRKLMYDEDCAFIIGEGVSVFGGYSSRSAGKSLGERDTGLYKTLLSGYMGCDMLSGQTVIYGNGAILDGCYVDGNLSSVTYSAIPEQAAAYIRNSILYIKSAKEISSVSLYDVSGKLVYTSDGKFHNMEIPLNVPTNRFLILILVIDGKTGIHKLPNLL